MSEVRAGLCKSLISFGAFVFLSRREFTDEVADLSYVTNCKTLPNLFFQQPSYNCVNGSCIMFYVYIYIYYIYNYIQY